MLLHKERPGVTRCNDIIFDFQNLFPVTTRKFPRYGTDSCSSHPSNQPLIQQHEIGKSAIMLTWRISRELAVYPVCYF